MPSEYAHRVYFPHRRANSRKERDDALGLLRNVTG